MEEGVLPWEIPWTNKTAPCNFKSGIKYRGLNSILLLVSGFSCNKWGTFKQITEEGGKIKKGERGRKIIFWTKISHSNMTSSNSDENEDKTKLILKTYTVFNLEQTEGLESLILNEVVEDDFNPIQNAENIILNAREEIKIFHSGSMAYYAPLKDSIYLPSPTDFKSINDYYSTKFHECIHWTGIPERLNRYDVGVAMHARKEEYSFEELVAEFGSCFLMAEAGLLNDDINRSSSSYIAHWLKFIKSNPEVLPIAINKAQRACDWILNRDFQ